MVGLVFIVNIATVDAETLTLCKSSKYINNKINIYKIKY